MKRTLIITIIAIGLALAACGGTATKSATSNTPTGAPTKAAAIPLAQDRSPGEPNYWAPKYEDGLVSACVNNKIAPTENMCNCIVSHVQAWHPAAAESPANRTVIQEWMRTASGDPFGLREYALNCSGRE